MLKRHEIQVLLKAGHSQAEVAQLTGVSIRSVNRVAKEGDVVHVDDAAERLTRGIGRPSLVEHFRKLIADLLEQERNLKSVEVLRRMRLAGYAGQKTALFALIAAVRPKDQTPLVRFEGLPGEFSQHDFGQVDVASGSLVEASFAESVGEDFRILGLGSVERNEKGRW